MSRDEFAAFVGNTLEQIIQLAEQKSGTPLQRRYAFRWLGQSQPTITDNIVEYIVSRVFVDETHIYPCIDIGVADVLDDGALLIMGNVAGYSPREFGTNWTGEVGPFVHVTWAPFAKTKCDPLLLS